MVDRHDIWYNIDLEGEMIELAFEDAFNSKMHQGENECFRQYLNLHVNVPVGELKS